MDVNHARGPRSRTVLLLGLALTAAGAGCGGDSDSSADAFLGTWQLQDGMASAMCGALNPTSPLTGAQVKLTAGTDSPLQVDVRGCLMKFDISGKTASARAGQSCQTTFEVLGSNASVDLTVSSATFAVNGSLGELNMSGSATIAFIPSACPYTVSMAHAMKIGP
jgi:hypothetical protein